MSIFITEYAGYGNQPWQTAAPVVPCIVTYPVAVGATGPVLNPNTRVIRIYNDNTPPNVQVNIGISPTNQPGLSEIIPGNTITFRSIVDPTGIRVAFF